MIAQGARKQMVDPELDERHLGVTLRAATPADEARLLTWRNDPVTREQSFDQQDVTAERHRAWFQSKLSDPACAILIVEANGEPVGQVRLERVASRTAEVHISLSAAARGRGIGPAALRQAARRASDLLGVATLEAQVKVDNPASLRAFRAAGFQDVSERGGVVSMRSAGEAES